MDYMKIDFDIDCVELEFDIMILMILVKYDPGELRFWLRHWLQVEWS